MKPLIFLGLTPLLLLLACGDDGGSTTGTGATTDATTSSSTGGDPTTAPTTGPDATTGTTGDSAGETTGTGTTGPGTTDATDTAPVTDSDATTTTTGDGETTAETTEDGGDASSGSSDSSTGAPDGDPLAIALKEVIIYANCQPIIDPDNILGFWTVTYDNSQGAVESSAELTKATITLSPGDMPSAHDITVTPTGSGPVAPGEVLEQEQMKQKGAPTPGCGFCGQPYRLDLVFASGGVDVPVVHEDILGCVY